jgi:hypothetical protein
MPPCLLADEVELHHLGNQAVEEAWLSAASAPALPLASSRSMARPAPGDYLRWHSASSTSGSYQA